MLLCWLMMAAMKARFQWILLILLGGTSLWVMSIFHPGWACFMSGDWVSVEIDRDHLRVDPQTANDVAVLRRLVDRFAPDGQKFIVVPFWPGAYALFERKAPMWEIYALFPRSQAFEQDEITRIKAASPRFALIIDQPLDGRDALRFLNTHPLTVQYIRNNFELLSENFNPLYLVYKAKKYTP
jgi:hypothetical protein